MLLVKIPINANQLLYSLCTLGCSSWAHPCSSRISLRAEDNIQFYDYMGSEPLIIQYEIVLDLDSFRSLLLELARNTPGEAFIKGKKYHILDEKFNALKLVTDTWVRYVGRGGRLYQSIDVQEMTSPDLSCPRPSCPGTIMSVGVEQLWFVRSGVFHEGGDTDFIAVCNAVKSSCSCQILMLQIMK
jgi:hypothetical protein